MHINIDNYFDCISRHKRHLFDIQHRLYGKDRPSNGDILELCDGLLHHAIISQWVLKNNCDALTNHTVYKECASCCEYLMFDDPKQVFAGIISAYRGLAEMYKDCTSSMVMDFENESLNATMQIILQGIANKLRAIACMYCYNYDNGVKILTMDDYPAHITLPVMVL